MSKSGSIWALIILLLIALAVAAGDGSDDPIAKNHSAMNESDPLYWYNNGEILYNSSEYSKSLEAYNKAIELNPSYALAWSRKGRVLRSLGKYNESLEDSYLPMFARHFLQAGTNFAMKVS